MNLILKKKKFFLKYKKIILTKKCIKKSQTEYMHEKTQKFFNFILLFLHVFNIEK